MSFPCKCGHDLDEHFTAIDYEVMVIGCWIDEHKHPCQFMRCKCVVFKLDNLRYLKQLDELNTQS